MRAQRPFLAERYIVHLPIDRGDATPRFVGTSIATGQSVIVAVVSRPWAKIEAKAVAVAHRHLAALIEAIELPDVAAFPAGFELPEVGTALVAELVRGVSLFDLLREGPLLPDRAVAWSIRILEGLNVLHRRGGCHGAISAAAIVAEPKHRPIAPVVSRLVIPPLRDYASPERLRGAGPTARDDVWAVSILLFEMLTGRRPQLSGAARSANPRLGAEDGAFLRRLPHGAVLESILRRALGEAGNRFSSAAELLEGLDCWERRVALPVSLPVSLPPTLARPAVVNTGLSPAVWDPVVDEFSCGTKRLDAILDAAEQMRQSIQPERAAATALVPRSSKWPDLRRSSSRSPGNNRGPKSSDPKQRRRQVSIGPELALFAARSRPKLKPWLIGCGILVCLSVVVVNLWPYLDTRLGGLPPVAPSLPGTADAGSSLPSTSHSVARPRRSAREETTRCITSYFHEGAVQKDADLGFVCTEEDFLNVNRRLHEESMTKFVVGAADAIPSAEVPRGPEPSNAVASASSSPLVATAANKQALVVRSGTTTTLGWQLGWYELVATAIIRQNCCREAVPIKLPETTGWCQQLQGVVRRIASDSVKVGDISPGIRGFDEAITCLLAQGKHAAYPYRGVPSNLQKSAFQQFLKRVAEVDAQRSANR